MWLAGADPLLIETTADRARITSMGCMVAFISLAACMSMTLATSILLPGRWAWLWHLPIGLLWGLIVLTIDRWIISTVDLGPIEVDDPAEKPWPRAFRQAAMIVGRVIMAVLIGLAISEPIILDLFKPEVDAHALREHGTHARRNLSEDLTAQSDLAAYERELRTQARKRQIDEQHTGAVGGGHDTTDSPKFSHFYAPPEQMTRAPGWISRAADVRAVTATFYRILTGLPPMFREAPLTRAPRGCGAALTRAPRGRWPGHAPRPFGI